LIFKRFGGSLLLKAIGETKTPLLKQPSKSQTRVGIVSSSKMQKTVSVVVERLVKHPIFKKYIKRRKKYKMHHEPNQPGNERNWLNPGDVVRMVATRPLSKTKHWELFSSASLLKKARVFDRENVNEKVKERKIEERDKRRAIERGSFAASSSS